MRGSVRYHSRIGADIGGKMSECIFYNGVKCTKSLNCELCHHYELWLKEEEKEILL